MIFLKWSIFMWISDLPPKWNGSERIRIRDTGETGKGLFFSHGMEFNLIQTKETLVVFRWNKQHTEKNSQPQVQRKFGLFDRIVYNF